MTVREQETLLRALDLWRTAVGQMSWEERAGTALAYSSCGMTRLRNSVAASSGGRSDD
jgi:hypothetical protein